MGAWLRKSVSKLVRFGYRLTEIEEMTPTQFLLHLKTTEQIVASERADFVVDMTTVAGSMFTPKGKKNPVKEHLDLLGTITKE